MAKPKETSIQVRIFVHDLEWLKKKKEENGTISIAVEIERLVENAQFIEQMKEEQEHDY